MRQFQAGCLTFVSIEAACKEFSLGRATIYRLIQPGKLAPWLDAEAPPDLQRRVAVRFACCDVRVEVRATGLKALQEKRGLTQRQLAHDLGISQNYIPAIEANTRQAGPKLQDALVK